MILMHLIFQTGILSKLSLLKNNLKYITLSNIHLIVATTIVYPNKNYEGIGRRYRL